MLRGVYRQSGESVEGLEIVERLRRVAGGDSVVCRGPLALGYGPGSRQGEADGVLCALDGRLFDAAALAAKLGAREGLEDAGLLAHGYRLRGQELLPSLRGRFALALWDQSRGRGLLSGDVLVNQPLFFRQGVGYLAFATELPHLLSFLPSRPGPDHDSFLGRLGGWTMAPERTFFEGVSRLAPGQCIELGRGTRTTTYWSPRYQGTIRGSTEELAEELRSRVERAVARRLAPRQTGVVLSGGLDSSIVTAFAESARGPDSAVRTYSAIFPGADYDEGAKVRSLTASLGIEPNLYECERQGALRLNLEHLQRWEQPLVGAGALFDIGTVQAAAEDGCELVVEGQTGDEVFGCSPWLVADRLRRGRLLAALRLANRWPGRPAKNRREQRYIIRNWGLLGAAPHWLNRLVRNRKDPAEFSPEWMRPELRPGFVERADPWEWKDYGSGPLWWRFLADTLVRSPHRELRLDYLRNRAATAGVAGETPLYDFDLIDFTLQLPPEIAFDPAHSRPLAREAVRGMIPDDVRLDNRKAVFSPFCFEMITGADAPGIERLLTAPDAELGAYVDLDQIRRLWNNPPEPGPGFKTTMWGTAVWNLAAAETWLRAQADTGFVERMLEQDDVLPPQLRRVSA